MHSPSFTQLNHVQGGRLKMAGFSEHMRGSDGWAAAGFTEVPASIAPYLDPVILPVRDVQPVTVNGNIVGIVELSIGSAGFPEGENLLYPRFDIENMHQLVESINKINVVALHVHASW